MARKVRLQELEPPRLLTDSEVAHLLGMSASAFSTRQRELELLGLPRRHPSLGRRDRKAIEQWLDALFGADIASDVDAIVAERLSHLGGPR